MRLPDALSRTAARQIDDRRRTFAAVAVALVALAVTLQLTATRPDPWIDAPEHPPLPEVAARAVQPVDHGDARRIARRFLTRDYLPDLYGHRADVTYRLAAPALRRRLAHERPRVSPATRRRRPRIRRLTVEPAADAMSVRVVATIGDGGAASYPIGIEVCPNPDGRPRVCDVLEAH